MQKNILVAEDSEEIVKILVLYLSSAGYNVITASNGVQALEKIKAHDIALAIVDIMMPQMDGLELIEEVRKFSDLPVIILSAKAEEYDKINGLNIGADDYITKPFQPLELMARVNASLRRWHIIGTPPQEVNHIDLGALHLDLDAFSLKKNDEDIPLTASEYRILKVLMAKPKQIFSKKQLCELMHGDYFDADDNVIMVHISHIREKIGKNEMGNSYIKTIRGLGYKFENN